MRSRPAPDEIEAYFQGERAVDVRFEFEIIKHLSESIRTQTEMIGQMQKQQSDILIRLERIEAKEHGEQLAACLARVDALEEDYQRRQGRDGLVVGIMRSPLLAWLVVAAGVVYTIVRDAVK
jgi:hypothetical protein